MEICLKYLYGGEILVRPVRYYLFTEGVVNGKRIIRTILWYPHCCFRFDFCPSPTCTLPTIRLIARYRIIYKASLPHLQLTYHWPPWLHSFFKQLLYPVRTLRSTNQLFLSSPLNFAAPLIQC